MTNHECMLRIGRLTRIEGESTVDLLKRQKRAILEARAADAKAKSVATDVDNLRREIRDLGHDPAA